MNYIAQGHCWEAEFEHYANSGFSVLINPAGAFRFKNAVWKSFVILLHKFSLIEKNQLFHKGLTRGDTWYRLQSASNISLKHLNNISILAENRGKNNLKNKDNTILEASLHMAEDFIQLVTKDSG